MNYKSTPNWAKRSATPLAAPGSPTSSTRSARCSSRTTPRCWSRAVSFRPSACWGSDFSWTKQNPEVNLVPIAVGNRDQHEAMARFMVEHRINPVVDVVYDLDRIQDAYRCLESGQFFGKVAVNLL
ncbi:MAG: zinc-binding dehydrogenase [Candidatus Nanopelagicales bacterium]